MKTHLALIFHKKEVKLILDVVHLDSVFQPVNWTSACTLHFCKGRNEKQYLASQQESTLPVWKEENQNCGFFCTISLSQKSAGNIMLFWGFISSDAQGDFFLKLWYLSVFFPPHVTCSWILLHSVNLCGCSSSIQWQISQHNSHVLEENYSSAPFVSNSAEVSQATSCCLGNPLLCLKLRHQGCN